MLTRDPCGPFDLSHDGLKLTDCRSTQHPPPEPGPQETFMNKGLTGQEKPHRIQHGHDRSCSCTTRGSIDLRIGKNRYIP